MVGPSKILTVSYGTFSCTLEGFDDSFSTMKAIAEYFRDLAADDRYFGAEPPTPDAEMLARIAEREIERRVVARIDGNEVKLRAADETEADHDARALSAPVAAAAVAAQDASVETQIAPVEEAEETVKIEEDDEVTSSEEDISDLMALDGADGDALKEDTLEETDIEPVAETEIETPVVDAPVQELTEQAAEADVAPDAPTPSGDSVAEKLQRIRAMVSGDTRDETTDFIEDEHADDTLNDLSGALDEFDLDDTEDDAPTAGAPLQDQFDEEDSAENVAETAQEDETDISSVLAQIADDVDNTPSVTEAQEETADEETAGSEDLDTDMAAALAAAMDDTPETEAQAEVEAPAQPIARVIKVKRADFEKAISEGQLEEIDEDDDFVDSLMDDDEADDDDSAVQVPGRTTLSQQEEAELQAELDAVQKAEAKAAEPAAVEVEAEAEIDAPAAVAAELPKKTLDVDRLMDQADRELNAPETGRRQNAIAHLKAAVAATEAERREGGGEPKDVTEDYRADLAQVVRPRRATSKDVSATRRPSSVPPLKLVAEQRVDIEPQEAAAAEAPVAPVRPRRISKPTPEQANAGGFEEFAETMGATELPDLLEAAAAYMSFVEGKPSFSRPQVMRAVASAQGKDDFSREDGLRSFGQLLRQGKISKQKAGQFVVAETSRFNPQARYAGE